MIAIIIITNIFVQLIFLICYLHNLLKQKNNIEILKREYVWKSDWFICAKINQNDLLFESFEMSNLFRKYFSIYLINV